MLVLSAYCTVACTTTEILARTVGCVFPPLLFTLLKMITAEGRTWSLEF